MNEHLDSEDQVLREVSLDNIEKEMNLLKNNEKVSKANRFQMNLSESDEDSYRSLRARSQASQRASQ